MADARRDEARTRPSDPIAAPFGPIGGEADQLADPGLDMSRLDVSGARADDEPAVDRSHNRETLSSEAMTEMLRDLQDSLAVAEARVSGLEIVQGRLSGEGRDLALGVAALGDTLSRRVRALESRAPARLEPSSPLNAPSAPIAATAVARPAPRKPEPVLRWTVILAVALTFILAAFWLLGGQTAGRQTPPPRPAKPIAIVQAAPRAPSSAAARITAPLGHRGTASAGAQPNRETDSADDTDTR